MKKKILFMFVAIGLLGGCSKKTEASAILPTNKLEIVSKDNVDVCGAIGKKLNAYIKKFGTTNFGMEYEKESITWERKNLLVDDESSKKTITVKFAIQDIDNNGVSEYLLKDVVWIYGVPSEQLLIFNDVKFDEADLSLSTKEYENNKGILVSSYYPYALDANRFLSKYNDWFYMENKILPQMFIRIIKFKNKSHLMFEPVNRFSDKPNWIVVSSISNNKNTLKNSIVDLCYFLINK